MSVRESFLASLDSLGYDTAQTAGPRVRISTEMEGVQTNRIVSRIHVADDAYVAVLNVWPSGVASVIFPESPEDTGFLPGGRTYAIPSMFSGYATMFPPTGAHGLRYVRFHRSSDVRVGARGPGYLVLIASRTPLDLAALDEAGYFTDVELGPDVREMEPSVVIPRVAVLASGGNTAVTLEHARYGGYDPMTLAASPIASGYDSRDCVLAYFGTVMSYTWDLDYGAAGCGARAWDRDRMLINMLRRPPQPPMMPRDTVRPPADTLHEPQTREAEIRAAWASLVSRSAARYPAPDVADDDEVIVLPRSRGRQALDHGEPSVGRNSGEGRAQASERIDRAPERAVPLDRGVRAPRARETTSENPRRNAPSSPRAEAAPPRASPSSPRAEPVPRPRPPERQRSEDPEPQPVPSSGTP
ncbi:MAG: DUF4384 domain-containing protein [Gemmatimonadaceae bacterium]|nr:DUF4384 domain-containing protein [Gemmatimonadaceae bacterium]